jgi:hypothetical protein
MIGLVLASFIFLSGLSQNHTATRDIQYSNANEIPIDSQAVLVAFAKSLNVTGLGRLRVHLSGYQNYATPNGTEDPLGDYIKTVSQVLDHMVQMNATLRDTREFVNSGQTEQVVVAVNTLERLRDETSGLLGLSRQLLQRVALTYQVDTTAQEEQLNILQTQFRNLSAQITQLAGKVGPEQGVQTLLTLNASTQQAFVGEAFFVYGLLRTQNQSALPDRNVTLTWGSSFGTTQTTDRDGRFNASVTFPVGFPEGLVDIEARFTPQGNDTKDYQPSAAVVVIAVSYERTLIQAQLSQGPVKPLDYANVTGTLSTIRRAPIANATMVIELDSVFIGDSLTDNSGAFNFQFTAPLSLSNGTHFVQITFPATNQRFAPANVSLPLVVEKFMTQLNLTLDRSTLFSGMTLGLNGTATYANGTTLSGGIVSVFLDGIPYNNATLGSTGSFNSTIALQPWLSFGSHTIQISYVPDQPQVLGSKATEGIFVYPTPGIVGIITIAVASTSIAVSVSRRRRRAAHAVIARPAMAPKPLEEFTAESLTASIRAETTPTAKIRKVYHLAQGIIDRKEGSTPLPSSQTHWEYFGRAIKTFPTIEKPLRQLVELYELAEYSEFLMGGIEVKSATDALLEIRNQIDTVK